MQSNDLLAVALVAGRVTVVLSLDGQIVFLSGPRASDGFWHRVVRFEKETGECTQTETTRQTDTRTQIVSLTMQDVFRNASTLVLVVDGAGNVTTLNASLVGLCTHTHTHIYIYIYIYHSCISFLTRL
jgi:hypothetical protein